MSLGNIYLNDRVQLNILTLNPDSVSPWGTGTKFFLAKQIKKHSNNIVTNQPAQIELVRFQRK